jgi:hypothetical protein
MGGYQVVTRTKFFDLHGNSPIALTYLKMPGSKLVMGGEDLGKKLGPSYLTGWSVKGLGVGWGNSWLIWSSTACV